MTDTDATTTTAPHRAPSRLTRPRDGRVVAGVARAISLQSNLPVAVIRLVFVISAFIGGVGIALYIAGWVLIPEEGSNESLGKRWFTNLDNPRSWVGIALIVFAILILGGSTGLVDGEFLLAAVLGVVGVLLYRGDLRVGHAGEGETVTGSAPPPPPPPPPRGG
jgi:phage shock protein PspC (stress-responsive transcriptional regulator)